MFRRIDRPRRIDLRTTETRPDGTSFDIEVESRTSLVRHRLIDEYRLTIQPVALGDGLSLLHGLPEPQRLNLYSSTAYPDGAITQTYVPAR